MKTVLVVDDEVDLVQLYQIVLETAGFEVHSALNGKEALRIYEQSKPHLILLDVMMPGMSGIEVCRQIREGENSIRSTIIMYTADDSAANRHASREAGADELLSKDVSIDEVAGRIRSYLSPPARG